VLYELFSFFVLFFPKAFAPKDNGMWREWAPLGGVGIGTSVLSNYYRRLQKKSKRPNFSTLALSSTSGFVCLFT
jgi:hypothetical protein